MKGYVFALCCPYDGADLEPVVTAKTNGFSTRAVAECSECHTGVVVDVRLGFCDDNPNDARARRVVTPAKRAALAQVRGRQSV